MKEKKENKVQSFLEDVFEELLDEPIVLIPIVITGIIATPIVLYKEHRQKRKILKDYGETKYKIEDFEKVTTLNNYIKALRKEYQDKCIQVLNKDFSSNDGYLDIYLITKEMSKLVEDAQTIEFIKHHFKSIIRLEFESTIDKMIEHLKNKEFKEANRLLEENT